VRLSGPAHQLIGKAAASLLRGNHTVNVGDTAQDSDNDEKASKEETPSFELKFPPGY
jgi:hypothetical protein